MHPTDQPTQAVAKGQVWADQERGRVTVLAVHDGWAWLKRRRRNPFTASTDQMLRGKYGWHRVENAGPDSEAAQS